MRDVTATVGYILLLYVCGGGSWRQANRLVKWLKLFPGNDNSVCEYRSSDELNASLKIGRLENFNSPDIPINKVQGLYKSDTPINRVQDSPEIRCPH